MADSDAGSERFDKPLMKCHKASRRNALGDHHSIRLRQRHDVAGSPRGHECIAKRREAQIFCDTGGGCLSAFSSAKFCVQIAKRRDVLGLAQFGSPRALKFLEVFLERFHGVALASPGVLYSAGAPEFATKQFTLIETGPTRAYPRVEATRRVFPVDDGGASASAAALMSIVTMTLSPTCSIFIFHFQSAEPAPIGASPSQRFTRCLPRD